MIWRKPKHNTRKWVKRFALIPKDLHNGKGEVVFLEFYWQRLHYDGISGWMQDKEVYRIRCKGLSKQKLKRIKENAPFSEILK